ncbi:tetratricopeptide repeat protein [Ancylostoma ceylanicum]|uniref:Tetratricopeptide repeat protein n=1 Tax=Ancylostoma ceylanicum TaxID=53326 RepID=A0A0D6LBF7_9BILA|nr:tetratricopeptide repeat protein [Ancylostoma ceylanicum]
MLASWGLMALLCVSVQADLFTSMAEMQGLLDSEKAIPAVLYKYIEDEQKRLVQLRERVNLFYCYRTCTDTVLLQIFDWKAIESKMLANKADDFIERMSNANYGIRYPTEEDLTGAAIGLLRLQDTYRLDTTDLAQGRIYKDQGNYTFDAGDCFTIAKAAYNDGDYYHVIMWMEEALKRLEQEDEPTADREDVLEYLSYSLYKQGNLKHALKLVEELYKLNPRHPRAKGNIKWYEDLLAQEGVKKADMRRSLGRVVNERPLSVLGNEERSIYEALCRNEVPVVCGPSLSLLTPGRFFTMTFQSEKELSKLYCYYKRDRPFLVYAPIKVGLCLPVDNFLNSPS